MQCDSGGCVCVLGVGSFWWSFGCVGMCCFGDNSMSRATLGFECSMGGLVVGGGGGGTSVLSMCE
jgi:hypothetical protein